MPKYRLSHLFVLILIVALGLGLFVSLNKQKELENRYYIHRNLALPRIDLEQDMIQIVRRHGIALPECEGSEHFEVFLPAGETRWVYLIAADDASFGPLTGYFLLESNRRHNPETDLVKWQVRAWRLGDHQVKPEDLLGEVVVEVDPHETQPRIASCVLRDRTHRVSPSHIYLEWESTEAGIRWPIYLYDKPNATGQELRE